MNEELRKDLRELDEKRTKLFMKGKISKEDYIECGILIRRLYNLLGANKE
jgi:uncharacterized protein YqgQ